MDKTCCVCGKLFEGRLEYCEDCRERSRDLFDGLPQDRKDALWSELKGEMLLLIVEEASAQQVHQIILDYVWLIGVGLQSGVDLMRRLMKEANMNSHDARLLVQEILTLYLE